MRIAIGLSALALLAACGGNKAANTSANKAANTSTANVTPPANSAAAANVAAPATTATAARAVRIGINGAEGMDACHTNGRLTGQGAIAIREAPDAAARQNDEGENGLLVTICEEVPGYVGIVWLGEGDPDHDCGTGANLPGPKNYDGPCRSGWVAAANVEVTAG